LEFPFANTFYKLSSVAEQMPALVKLGIGQYF
jgi:hypothetical protein